MQGHISLLRLIKTNVSALPLLKPVLCQFPLFLNKISFYCCLNYLWIFSFIFQHLSL